MLIPTVHGLRVSTAIKSAVTVTVSLLKPPSSERKLTQLNTQLSPQCRPTARQDTQDGIQHSKHEGKYKSKQPSDKCTRFRLIWNIMDISLKLKTNSDRKDAKHTNIFLSEIEVLGRECLEL